MPARRLASLTSALLLAVAACGGVPSDAEAAQPHEARISQRDVVALANIHHFSHTSSAPHHHELSREQIKDLTALLNYVIDHNNGRIPPFYSEASTFWANLQRSWPDLSAAQRNAMRARARQMTRISAPPPVNARQRSAHDHRHGDHSHDRSANGHQHHDHSAHAHDHRAHDHNHSAHAHDHSKHDHRHSSHQRDRKGPTRRYDPAAVTAEVGNFPIMNDAIFPP
jgi:hypothetical protein